MSTRALIVAILTVLLMVAGIAYMGIFHGFGAQCTKAGFTGAEHEKCVIRASKGGTVYPENMPKQPY